jgi:predicted dienelactone hydrolase
MLKFTLGVVLLVLLGVALLWLEHRTDTVLPMPTGTFAVGRVQLDWVDQGVLDRCAPAPGADRELAVWIWYPAAADRSASACDYLPAQSREAVERARGLLITHFLTRDLSRVHAHSICDPDVSPRQPRYPVVIMRAGASASVIGYSTLAEDLASHGYVVVGFDAPYRTQVVVFPDGREVTRARENDPESAQGLEQDRLADRLLAAWVADTTFVLDRLERLNSADSPSKFTNRLDMTQVGMFGHSLGGATAAQFCHDDPRCKAGIDIDGAPRGSVVQSGICQPFMFLLSDHGDASDPASRRIRTDIQSIYDRLPRQARVRVAIRGANHFGFSDDAVLKSHILLRSFRAAGLIGLDGSRQLAVTAYCVRSFFDAHLKQTGALPSEFISPDYPELQLLE